MSAIAAVYNLNGKPVETDTLERIGEKLAHRGSDRSGRLSRGPVGLVHRMRWTTPESVKEELPAKSPSGAHFITCDARLDNRNELISRLSFNGQTEEVADSRLILAAYEKWGEDAPAELLGDFVFVIWDARRRKLFAARDQLGVKHFYYFYRPGKLFALASEIKALFEIEDIERRLNEEAVGDYLVLNSEEKESTFFKDIKRLPATHALSVDENGLRTRRYWQPDTREIKLKSDAEYHEAFREKLTEAVVARLRSYDAPGSFLSGGLDSSAIVCLAGEHLKQNGKPPLKTFSAVFPTIAQSDPRIEERHYMQSVIDKTGCEATFVTADDEDPLNYMDRIFWHADHPVGAPNVYMDCRIFRAAEEKNVRVLLSGTDGDSTVSYGYQDFAQLAYRRMYYRLFRDAIALGKNMPLRSHSFKRLIWHRGFKQTVPPSLIKLWRAVRRRRPEDFTPSPILYPLHFSAVKPEIREAFQLEKRIAECRNRSFPDDADPAQHHWNGLTSGHFSFMLEQFEKIAAAFGVEMRFPFFDRRLIEFCIALPPGQRIYKGWTRSIFRHAMEGILPKDVQWRVDKSNIGASFKMNLLKYGLENIEEAIESNPSALEKYVDVERLRQAYRKYQSEPLTSDTEALLILTNVYLSNWLRKTNFV